MRFLVLFCICAFRRRLRVPGYRLQGFLLYGVCTHHLSKTCGSLGSGKLRPPGLRTRAFPREIEKWVWKAGRGRAPTLGVRPEGTGEQVSSEAGCRGVVSGRRGRKAWWHRGCAEHTESHRGYLVGCVMKWSLFSFLWFF